MQKHRGFPGRMPGSDAQFTIRRERKKGVTPLKARERYADRRPVDKAADRIFLTALWDYFGAEAFERGNLDAGRLSWLFGREVVAVEDMFDAESYDAMLRIDEAVARRNFPDIFVD